MSAVAPGMLPNERGEDASESTPMAAPPQVGMKAMPPWEAELQDCLTRTAPKDPEVPSQKTIIFVRHAESLSNVYKRRAKSRPWACCQLCVVGFDAPLSEKGLDQLERIRDFCQSLVPELQAVLHSPLQRTQQTAEVCFGREVDKGFPRALRYTGGTATTAVPWLPLQVLMEERLEEHLEERGFGVWGGPAADREALTTSAQFRRRVQAFLAFAWRCPWATFAVVGHSLWIRAFMQFAMPNREPLYVDNANVWRLTLIAPAETGGLPTISELVLVAKPEEATE